MLTAPPRASLGSFLWSRKQRGFWLSRCWEQEEQKLHFLMQVEKEEINHEYLPVLGLEAFSKSATSMLLGENSAALKEGRTFGVQVLRMNVM